MNFEHTKKTIIAFLPNAFAVSLTVMLDEIQIELNQGNRVILIGCERSINHCDYNITGSKYICIACNHCLKNAIKFLKGNFEYHSLKSFLLRDAKYPYTAFDENVHNMSSFKSLKYKEFEIGYSVAATYISVTRNHNPYFSNDFKRFIVQLYCDSAYVYDAGEILFGKWRPDKVLIYNGRLHTSRPILSLANTHKIPIEIIEVIGGYGNKPFEKVKFVNSLPHNIKTNTSLINEAWENITEDEIAKAKSFFENRRKGIEAGDKVYVKDQSVGLLPPQIDTTKNNIAIYVSSDDEMAAIGKEWEWDYFGGGQLNAIKRILELFKGNNNYHFFLRVHPNLKEIKYKYHTCYYTLDEKHNNLTIIHAKSPISTYALLDACNKVITFGSTVGAEATYWGKPSILIGKSMYMYLNATYNPQTENELLELLKDKNLKPKPVLGALKYGYYLNGRSGAKLDLFDCNKHRKAPMWLNHNLYLLNLDPERRLNFNTIINFFLFSSSRFVKNFILKKRIPTSEA